MAHQQSYAPGGPPGFGQQPPAPEPPRNARGETPVETERRWLSNIAAVFLPFLLAGKLLKPKYRTGRPDPLMERVIRIRAWLGLAVVFAVVLRVFWDKSHKTPTVPTGTTPTGGLNLPGSAQADVATGLPTGLPTNFPTNFSTAIPTLPGGGFPTNIPTSVPTGGGLTPTTPSVPDTSSVKAYGDGAVSVVHDIAGALIQRIILAPLLCALGLVILGLVLVLCARPHVRRQTIHQLSHPIRVILLFALIPLVGAGVYIGLRRASGLKDQTGLLNHDGTTLQLVCSWAAAFVSMWSVMFALGALWQITRHLFAAIDGHPMLPALLGMWLAWTLTVDDLSIGLGDRMLGPFANAEDTVPSNIKAAITILGSTVVTVLALWELSRLNKWNGINMRSGPWGNRA